MCRPAARWRSGPRRHSPESSQVSGALGPSGPDVSDAATGTGITLTLVLGLTVTLFLAYFAVRGLDLF